MFVDFSVAIIIETVADFGLGLKTLLAQALAFFAAQSPDGAETLTVEDLADIAALWIVFVGQAVAIVVHTVADFGGGLDGLLAGQRAADASPFSFLASAFSIRQKASGSDQGVAFVDASVAIVVEGVAAFDLGRDFSDARPPPQGGVFADLHTAFAEAFSDQIGITAKTFAALSCCARTRSDLIDLSVAVVV